MDFDQGQDVAVRELVRSPVFGAGEIDFSVIIPTYNRAQKLIQCLNAISMQAYPTTRYEVIVVDDGSHESMEAVVAPFLGRMSAVLLRQPNSGPAAARNAGAAVARGHYVAFTDDGCRPDPSWLGALAESFAAKPGCAVGGQTISGLPENLFSSASQLVLECLYRYLNRDEDDALFVASNNLAFPRARFIEIQGFNSRFPWAAGEDLELCDRWRGQHGRIVYTPHVLVHHFHALNLKTFLAQHFNYGRGAVIFGDIRRRRTGNTMPAPNERFYLKLLSYVFANERGFRAVLLATLVELSQIAVQLGYLGELSLSLLKRGQRRDLMDQRDGVPIQPMTLDERAASSRR